MAFKRLIPWQTILQEGVLSNLGSFEKYFLDEVRGFSNGNHHGKPLLNKCTVHCIGNPNNQVFYVPLVGFSTCTLSDFSAGQNSLRLVSLVISQQRYIPFNISFKSWSFQFVFIRVSQKNAPVYILLLKTIWFYLRIQIYQIIKCRNQIYNIFDIYFYKLYSYILTEGLYRE